MAETEIGAFEVIEKSSSGDHNLVDYERACASFDWAQARGKLDGLPDGQGINIAHEAVVRHAQGELAEKVAIRWLGIDGSRREISYRELDALSNKFANLLQSRGIEAGDRLFMLCNRLPELYIATLGTLKHRAVFSPLFSQFGPEPIAQRVGTGDGRAMVTTRSLYKRKVHRLRERLPELEHIFLVDGVEGLEGEGLVDLQVAMQECSEDYSIGATDGEDMALLHFTSGTTGKPKGAVHVHGAVVNHHHTGALALDMRPDDVFWCTADPGWVTGTSYGIIAPLTHGLTMIIDQGEFNAERWYQTLQDEGVTNWYTAPTAIRMLMKAGEELPQGFDLSALRFIASVGEPLNPEAILWAQRALDMPIHDNWWQSETGGIMIANYASQPIKPGSMGRPLPGIEAAIVSRDGDKIELLEGPGAEGELALKPGWPSMFRGYLHEPERYEKCFVDGWYLSGDMACCDEDGYFWFLGRADDMIKSAGHLIGPFEVESALLEHEAVAEAGVIGLPHEVAGEIVKAYVSLHHGFEASDALLKELRGFSRKRLGSAVAPREIEIVDSLPKTRSGKIMRRLLKARELGLPEGDTSTLETEDSADV